MMIGTTNSEELKSGVELIAENHNLAKKLEDTERLLNAILADQAAKDRAAREEEERRNAEEEARRQAELDEAIEHVERLKRRDYEHDHYLRIIYGRRKARPGTRHEWAYHSERSAVQSASI